MMVELNNDKSHSEARPHPRVDGKSRSPGENERQAAQYVKRPTRSNNHLRQSHGEEVQEVGQTDPTEGDAQKVYHIFSNVSHKSKSSKEQDIIGTVENLEAAGDKLQSRHNDDGVIRFGFQNINSIDIPRTNKLPREVEVIHELGIDICGYAETNKPWTNNNKGIYDANMRRMFQNMANTQYASLPPIDHQTTYQPGGVLQTITGHVTGRVRQQGSDKYGRFAWHLLQGSRDEGIVVITAYRVCQTSNAGPNTAFTHQQSAMMKDGVVNPRPRKQVLIDLTKFIAEMRLKGCRPIVMLDANGSTFTDKEFREFQQNAILEDPFYEKFNEMPRTYNRGTKRLDYILMDASLQHAIRRIGYLGTHEAVFSDHAMAWVDFDETMLFRGLINRPPNAINRQFTLHQEDKVLKFMDELRKAIEEKDIQLKVVVLQAKFHMEGCTSDAVRAYNALDKEYTDIVRAVLKKTARRRYGYFRSPELTLAGRKVLLYKAMLDCRRRKAPPSAGLIKIAKSMGYDLTSNYEMKVGEIRRKVREARKELWEIQKVGADKRIEWLEVQAQASAEKGGGDWEAKMNAMIKTVRAASTNRKLSVLTKGLRSGLDRIDVPVHEWMYSEEMDEVYHYDQGVFETHAAIQRSSTTSIMEKEFYAHHSLKVPDKNAYPIRVSRKEDGRLRIVEVINKSPFEWEAITSQQEIERRILQRNKRHLQQVAMEEGPSTQAPVKQFVSAERTEEVRQILDGKYQVSDQTTSETMEISNTLATWMGQLKQTEKEVEMEETEGSITPDQLQEAFRKVKEKTASHGDLHYTVWKAMVAEDEFAHWLSIMISLPFVYGFAPERWKSMTDVMLEKKKGNRQINQLRIIGLLEADFNTALKFFAREFAKKMESTGELSEEQWGCRKDKNSIDAAMTKLLTYEAARAKKSTIGMIYYDCVACYDRMQPSLSNIELAKRNFHEGILRARAAALQGMKRHVRTGLGVSDDTYFEGPGDYQIAGEIQGKADNPALFTASSSGILKTHAELAPGLELHGCFGERIMQRNNVSYVDDNDGNVSADYGSDRPLDELIERMKLSSTIWNEVVRYSGQSLAYHKCAWQILAWQVVRGELKPIMAIDETILLEDHKGAKSMIKFTPPNQHNKGLGYHLCPDGNQKKEYEVIMEKLRRISKSTSLGFLTASETKQLLYQRLMPTLDYVLTLTSFSKKQCKKMDTEVRHNLFPYMHFNRNSADAVLRGPMEQGGMEIPDMYSRQTELQTEYVVKQLRNGKTLAKDFLFTLEELQLQSGLITPLFEYKQKLSYMDNGLLVSLKNRLSEIDATIWIEELRTPSLQREGDQSIMEAFIKRDIKPTILRKLNAVRIYMRVFTLADLVVENGEYIGNTTLRGDFVAGSDWEWPRTTRPPKKWFSLFRRCIRETFCNRLDSRHHYTNSMELDKPLGKWYPVKRNTWFDCYRGKGVIYKRGESETSGCFIQKLTEQPAQSGFYKYDSEVDEVPIECYPMKMTEVDEGVWTRRPYQMATQQQQEAKPPGYITENTHLPGTAMKPRKTGSDGSVHREKNVAAAAWIIPTSQQEYVKACFLMSNISSVNSYRAELEGIYRALYHIHYLGIELGPEEELTQWFDNESGTLTSNRPLKTSRDKMKPEGDLLMAIQHLRQKLPFTVLSNHVRGHQDTKKKKKKEEDESDCDSLETTESNRGKEKDLEGLDDNALINIACDELAGETTAEAIAHPDHLPPEDEILQMPYEGSKAVLRIGKKWVTAGVKRHVYRARREPEIRKYIRRRHGWTEAQYDRVNWRIIGDVRRKSTFSQQRFTCKLMHGLLPVNHVRQHETQVAQCPNCAQCDDETIAHVFKCTHPEMAAKRAEIIAALRKKGLRKISKQILQTVAELVEQYANGGEMRATTEHPQIQEALEAQSNLGWDDFFRGYLVQEWLQALEATHNGDAYQQFYQFQKIIWYEVAFPQWQERNRLAHGSKSHDKRIESAKLAEELVWYRQHQDELPPDFRQRWAGHSIDEISNMSLATRRLWLHHIKIAKDAYDMRKEQREQNKQDTLSYYFKAFSKPKQPQRRRRAAALDEAAEHADKVVLYCEKGQPRIDSVLERLEKSKT